MLNILNLTKTNKLVLAAFVFLAVLAFGSGRAHAATLNVTGGCTLPIAINSVNAGANQSGCTAAVSPSGYGTNDTITIPAGTITLTADLPAITESVTIQGAGMGQTVISGDSGLYAPFNIESPNDNIRLKGMTIVEFFGAGIWNDGGALTLENIEVDGGEAQPDSGPLWGLWLGNSQGVDNSITTNNLYIHDLASTSGIVYGIQTQLQDGLSSTIDISNTTISNLTNSGGDVFGFLVMGVGTVNSRIVNTTIDNLEAAHTAIGFANVGGANSSDSVFSTVLQNITVTNVAGAALGQYGQTSSALFVGGMAGNARTASVTLSVGNALLAGNTHMGSAANCTLTTFSSPGTVNLSLLSFGHNISDDDSCSSFNQSGDQQNVSNILSTLGPLQNNGGAVPTRALLPGSPAIAAGGQVLGVTTDARGVARPDECSSVGAYQFEGAVCGASTPSASGGSNAGAPNTGVGSIAQILNVLASMLGIGLLTYVFRKQQRSS
jgi:lipopolysaccharide export system protein LptA